MNFYQLMQHYPQIKLRMRKTSGSINVVGKNLYIDVGTYQEFEKYLVAYHELCHFIECPIDRIFEPNLGMRKVQGSGKWRRTAPFGAVRKGLYRELRVDALYIATPVIVADKPSTITDEWVELYWVKWHRAFPNYNRLQMKKHIREKYYEYVQKYGRGYFFEELERRLSLMAEHT